MDFLEPGKERRNRIVLIISYCLVAVAIMLTSWMLLYQTDGYCLDKDGKVDRCGLVFISSQPSGASVFLDGKEQKFQTNGKVNLRSATYDFRLSRPGYHDWSRKITVEGGDVQRFDYPFLIPKKLTTNSISTFGGVLGFITQSPDRRWLVVAETNQPTQLKVIDLRDARSSASQVFPLQTSVLTVAESVQSWRAVEWADDNRHVLVQRFYTVGGATAHEYILFDRQNGTLVRNVTKELALLPVDELRLFDKKQNQFYVHNTETKSLRTSTLGGGAPNALQLPRVLAYKTYGNDTILYVTDTPLGGNSAAGKVFVVLQQGSRSSVLRMLIAAEKYLLDLSRYDGKWYVFVGSNSSKGVHVYRNPLDAVLAKPSDTPPPFRFLKLANANYAAFSATAQFILVVNGLDHTVYDIEHDKVFHFFVPGALDSPQKQVSWMDGNRLTFVSSGKLYMYEYDNANSRTLQNALPQYGTFFSPDYRAVYALELNNGTSLTLTQTSLLVE